MENINTKSAYFIFKFLYGEYVGYGSSSKKESHMLFLHHKEGNKIIQFISYFNLYLF